MAIEWGVLNLSTAMTFDVLDNSGNVPTDVLRAGTPFQIRVNFQVPAGVAALVGAGDTFRLRAYAESVGPGQELPIGQLIVPGVPFQQNYAGLIMNVNPNPLLGEEQIFNGLPVSGVYNMICVLQHLNGGVPTPNSGMSDYQRTVMFRAP
jgi:hypothetical protein